MYRISARQILAIALLSALFAAAGVACFDRWGSRFQQPAAAFNSDDDRRTAGCEELSRRQTEAASGTGDDRDLAAQQSAHASSIQ